MNSLDNRNNKQLLYNDSNSLNNLIQHLEQKHPLERKLSFFLDIRGILFTNNIKGSYIEYGCYRCETMFLAEKILDETNCITDYFGLDIFDSSNLKLTNEDLKHNNFDSKHFFKTNIKDINLNIFKKPNKIHLIQGDLRNQETLNSVILKNKINISVIDSNFISSLRSSIDHTLDNIVESGFVFIDDYFTNLNNGKPIVHNYFMKALKKRNLFAIDFKVYPPFAKSFIIFKCS